jgi:hypothetical protein
MARRGAQRDPAVRAHCGMTSVRDFADRPPHEMADGERLARRMRLSGWICLICHMDGVRISLEQRTRTLLCGDLFTQGGQTGALPSDIWAGEALRSHLDSSRTRATRARCSSGWPQPNRRCLHACTVARGAATAPHCCASWQRFSNVPDRTRRWPQRRGSMPDWVPDQG